MEALFWFIVLLVAVPLAAVAAALAVVLMLAALLLDLARWAWASYRRSQIPKAVRPGRSG